MNTPHKWAKEICHLVNGGEVERRNIALNSGWYLVLLGNHSIDIFNNPDYEFRIKPERVYPVTSLSDDLLMRRYSGYRNMMNHAAVLRDFANKILRQHIIDTEE